LGFLLFGFVAFQFSSCSYAGKGGGSMSIKYVNRKNKTVTPFAVAKAAPILFSGYGGR